jgi:acetyltransferase-like isoleucine patch superfamily enzyme
MRIGDDTLIAGDVSIFDNTNHPVSPTQRLSGERISASDIAPVVIGCNVWIGMRSIVMRGVTIGDNSVVAAGSVVTKSVPPNTLVAGNPAAPIRHLS